MNPLTHIFAALISGCLFAVTLHCETNPDRVREAIVGDAILNNRGYALLKEMTVRFGPRMPGTEGNRRSLDLLERELRALGIETRRERYTIPGWRRGDDHVALVSTPRRQLRAAALGYLDPHPPIEAALAFVESVELDWLEEHELRGKIALFAPSLRISSSDYERLANDFGVVGGLRINRKNGGQLLARTPNHEGTPPPFPVYSITVEEGRWMRAQMELEMSVRVCIETRSQCLPIELENLVARFPGNSGETIVVGGHFDSWDLGQGAIDNGLGVAQLFDTARLLNTHHPENAHTLEIVWFNAEEWGLWGSRDYVARHDLGGVRTMLNLDMVGEPIGINAMGFDHQVPFLKTFIKRLGAWNFDLMVANKTWLGSDHHPFILQGVPAITFNAPVAAEDVRFYHDFADTFDKVDPEMLARATALIALLTYDLVNDADTNLKHLTTEETAELFRKAGLEKRMRKVGQWTFLENAEGAEPANGEASRGG